MAGTFTHNGNIVQGLPSIASQVNYDNTSSGMAATQVQDAVDELKSGLNSVPKYAKVNVTIPSTVSAVSDLVPLPSGFTKSNCAIVDTYCDPTTDTRYFMSTLQYEGVQIFFTQNNVQCSTTATAASVWLGKTMTVILQTIPS